MHTVKRLLAVAAAASLCSAAPPQASQRSELAPLTTKFAAARQHYEAGMQYLENIRLEDARKEWRQAIAADANCALAHLMISAESVDPAEKDNERQRAQSLSPRVTPGERKMIVWLASAQENDYVTAITAMNDLQAEYPHDKRLAFLAGRWLINQKQYSAGQHVLERALALDTNYAPALNEIGYAYAFQRNYEPAVHAMERYAALLPGEPNPQDSYAEILRLSGHYEQALEHYHAALKIDAKFTSSQLGLGDTYALMGKQEQARAEYAKAVVMATSESEREQYEVQSAITYARENKMTEALTSLQTVVEQAHRAGLGLQEAQAHRMMAWLEGDAGKSQRQLDEAEAALEEKHQLSRIEKDEEQARILYARCNLVARSNAPDKAGKPAEALSNAALASRSEVIQQADQGCAGALALQAGKYADAINHLQEDNRNPLSLMLLSQAYAREGDLYQSQAAKKQLEDFREPTLEQALAAAMNQQQAAGSQ